MIIVWHEWYYKIRFDGLVPDYSISSAFAMEIVQSGTKLSIYWATSIKYVPETILFIAMFVFLQ